MIALKPLGGHKGMCLALLVEVVTAVLAGDLFDHELTHLFDPPWDAPRRTSHLFVGFDLAAFGRVEEIQGRLSRLLDLLRAQTAASTAPIVAPGDLEFDAARERLNQGIPLGDVDLKALRRIDAESPPEEHELD